MDTENYTREDLDQYTKRRLEQIADVRDLHHNGERDDIIDAILDDQDNDVEDYGSHHKKSGYGAGNHTRNDRASSSSRVNHRGAIPSPENYGSRYNTSSSSNTRLGYEHNRAASPSRLNRAVPENYGSYHHSPQ